MSNNINNIYEILAKRFNMSVEDIKKLDLQDEKADLRIKGLSIFHVLEKFTSKNNENFLKSENVYSEIEAFFSQKEPLLDISEYDYFSDNLIKKHSYSNTETNKTDTDSIVEDLINEIFKLGKANLDEPISKINSDNVVEVLEKYKKASDEKNTHLGVLTDNETLIEAILDESIPDSEKKKYINHIKDALVEKVESLSGDSTFLSKMFSRAIEQAIKQWWPFQNSDELDRLTSEFIKIIKQLEGLQSAGNKISTEKIREINLTLIALIEYVGLDINDLFKDIDINNEALQISGNCWIHAGVNAMNQSTKGKAYLNNLIVKNQNGNYTVYLPGAKNKGEPKPKGDGIYTFTQNQLAEGMENESIGNIKVTALCLAIKAFRGATTGKADTTGGSFSYFLDLVYGSSDNFKMIACRETDMKNYAEDAYLAQELLDSVIHSNLLTQEEKEEYKRLAGFSSLETMYQNVKKDFEDDNAIIYVSISAANYYRVLDGEDVVPDDAGGHGMTITEMTDDYVILVDSNDPNKPLKMNAMDFIRVCYVYSCKI